MAPMLTSSEAAEEFADVIPGFREAWHLAWMDMRSRYNDPDWDNRCRSIVLQMQAVSHARRIFVTNPNVTARTIDTRHVFSVRDSGLFRMKQLDENHCSHNYGTIAAKAYDGQSQIPGFEDFQRFTIGLIAKPDWTDYVGIFMTFPNGHRQSPNWVLDITGAPIDIDYQQEEFDDTVSQPTRRFRPLRRRVDEQSGGAGG